MTIKHVSKREFTLIRDRLGDTLKLGHLTSSTIELVMRALFNELGIEEIGLPSFDTVKEKTDAYVSAQQSEEEIGCDCDDCTDVVPAVTVETNTGETKWEQRLKIGNRIVLHVYDGSYFYFSGKGKQYTILELQQLLPQLTALATHGRLDDGTEQMIYAGKEIKTYAGVPMHILSTNGPNRLYPFIAISPEGVIRNFDRFGRGTTNQHNVKDLMLHGSYLPLTPQQAFDAIGRTIRPIAGGNRCEICGIEKRKDGRFDVKLRNVESGSISFATLERLLADYTWNDCSTDYTPVGTLVCA